MTVFTAIVRTLIVYFTLVLILRLLGKRQLGEMELSEFVVAALMADLAAFPLEDQGTPLLPALLPILVLAGLELLIATLTMRHIRLRALLFGTPSLLIDKGRLNQAEMRRNRFTADELMQALRSQGILDPGEIYYAILETNGTLNVISRAACQPASAGQLNLLADDPGYPTILISEGRILDSNLRRLGRDRTWLGKQLQAQGLPGPEAVFLLTADENGNVYCVKREA